MNILDLVDINVPSIVDNVEFYTVDPDTLSFVKFGSTLMGTSNRGKTVSLYVIASENISVLSITVSSSSNISATIDSGSKVISDFSGMQNNNTIEILNLQQNSPERITLFYSIKDNEWSNGDIEMTWSY